MPHTRDSGVFPVCSDQTFERTTRRIKTCQNRSAGDRLFTFPLLTCEKGERQEVRAPECLRVLIPRLSKRHVLPFSTLCRVIGRRSQSHIC